MATAVQQHNGGSGGGAAHNKAPHKDKKKAANKDSSSTARRRQAALLFLNNISLDGRPLLHRGGGGNNELHAEPFTATTSDEHRWGSSSTAEAPELLLHQRGSSLPLPQVTAAVAGVVTAGSSAPPPPPPPTTNSSTSSSESSASVVAVLSPVVVRPSSVVVMMSPPVPPGHRWSVVGLRGNSTNDSEVFLEGGGGGSVDAMLPPESPLSPGPHQYQFHQQQNQSFSLSLARSPSAFSPGAPGVASSSAASMAQRSRNVSGSPGPKVAKKVHFIKTMKQYDTRGCRIMLICAKRSLCAAFSVMPYGQSSVSLSDIRTDTQRQRLSSVVTPDLLPALEGVELGAYNGKTVSYAPFLYPTNALVPGRSYSALDAGPAHTPQPRYRGNNGQRAASRISSTVMQEQSIEDVVNYDPNLLSDPQWPCGRHKRVLIFASYVTTVIEYVKPSDLKKHMNQTFREKFPHIKLTLSKIRSLKREMRALSEEGGLQPATIAMAFVYFEKLVLQGRLNKANRKLVCAACVLLAAKISSDLRKSQVKQLIDRLEERFRINRKELIPLEFSVLVALEMGLYLPESMVMPHYRRLVAQG